MGGAIVIQSSLIASASYDAAGQRLLITFKDGATTVCCPVTPSLYGHFLISDSKGRFYRYHLAKLAGASCAAEPAIAEPAARPLHAIGVEDDCCTKPLYRAIATGKLDKAERWTHEKCGCEWRSRVIDGVISWTPVTTIQVF